jgi:hypothetical protein
MDSGELMQVVSTPFCQAIMLEPWNAAPGRWLVDYRARHGSTGIIGNGVVEEYRTISGPILLAPQRTIGGAYDAGMLLADERDVEAPIDQGWPPLTIGMEVAAPILPDDWKAVLVRAIQSSTADADFGLWENRLRRIAVGGINVQVLQSTIDHKLMTTIIVTDAGLLPQQLTRLVDTDNAPVTVAVATGNRLPRVADGELHVVEVAAESTVLKIAAGLRRLFSE